MNNLLQALVDFEFDGKKTLTPENISEAFAEYYKANPQCSIGDFISQINENITTDIKHNQSICEFWNKWVVPDNVSDRNKLISCKDRLVNADTRQQEGEFFTPLYLVNLAHDYLKTSLNGEDIYSRTWWDMCCGSGNLTLPCQAQSMPNIFLSTLHDEDIIMSDVRNRKNTAWAGELNFLDACEIPSEIKLALSDNTQRWVFILNPPYTSSSVVRNGGNEGIANTLIGNEMKKFKYNRASQNLTTQFLYRILKLTEQFNLDIVIVLFSQATFITNEGFNSFYNDWENEFKFQNGFTFHCNEFQGVKGEWPVLCSVWHRSKTSTSVMADIIIDKKISGKKLFKSAHQPLNKWIDRPVCTITAPPFTSAIKQATDIKKIDLDKMPADGLGWAVYVGNDVMNGKYSCLLSSPFANGGGWGITCDNFEQSMISIGCRALMVGNWLTDRDQFNVPNITHPLYDQFTKDITIWLLGSMFNQSASLGNINYAGNIYDIKNEFFWMLPNELPNCQDVETRFVAKWIQDKNFSKDAEWVISKMKNFVIQTIDERQNTDPELQLIRYDASWWQLRRGLLWPSNYYKPSENIIKEFQDYKKRHKALGKRLMSLIYELEILPKIS